MMRNVKVFEWKRLEGGNISQKVVIGIAKFHQFGVNYEEFENSAGNYTTAIIEYDNGEVKSVEVELIQFIDEIDL